MKMIDESYTTNPAFTNKSILRFACLTAVAVAMLFGGAGNCLASGSYMDFTWIAGSGTWQTGANWQTNFYSYHDTNLNTDACRVTNFVNEVRSNLTTCAGGGFGTPPDPADGFQSAFFTNASTYTVTLSANTAIASNVFANATNTEANVTMDLSGGQIECFSPFIVGAKAGSTTTVTLVTGTKKLLMHDNVTIGGQGHGTLYFNGGTIDNGTGSLQLGTGDGGRGVLIVSGASTWVQPNSQISVGNDPQQDPAGSLMVITNGAHVVCTSSFRLGSGSGKGGTSNNLFVICNNATLSCDSGPISIGVRSTGVTNSDGGTLCFNNVMLVKSGAMFCAAITSTKSMCIGDAAWFGLSQTTTATPPTVATGNVLRIEAGGVCTGVSTLFIGPTNSLELLGGWLKANTISNWGQVTAYGLHIGQHRVFAGGKLKTLNSLGSLIISNGLWMVTNSIMDVECGDATINHPTEIYFGGQYTGTGQERGGTNRFTVDGATLNIIGKDGFASRSSYNLFTYATNAPPGGWGSWSVDATNALGITNFTGFVIGTTPNPSYTYTIDTNTTLGVIRLLIGGIVPSAPFQIISIARQAGAPTNIVLTWTGPASTSYTVQTSPGLAGSYSNNFADLATGIGTADAGTTHSFAHTNGAAAIPSLYYRVKHL